MKRVLACVDDPQSGRRERRRWGDKLHIGGERSAKGQPIVKKYCNHMDLQEIISLSGNISTTKVNYSVNN